MKIHSLLLSIICFFGLIQAAQPTNQQRNVSTRNMVVLFESGSAESSFIDNKYMQQVFSSALENNAAAILVGASVVQAWIASMQEKKTKLAENYADAKNEVAIMAAPLLKKYNFDPFNIQSMNALEKQINDKIYDLIFHSKDKMFATQKKFRDTHYEAQNKFITQRAAIHDNASNDTFKIIGAWSNLSESERNDAFARVKGSEKFRIKENNRKKQQTLARLNKQSKKALSKVEEEQTADQTRIEILEYDREQLQSIRSEVENNLDLYAMQTIDKQLNSLSNYHIMECVGTEHYLFIPKFWPSEHITSSFQIHDASILKAITIAQLQDSVKSWGKHAWTQSSYETIQHIGSYIDKARQKVRSNYYTVNLNKLKTIFVPHSKNWIFHMSGHGWYSDARKGKSNGKNAGLRMAAYMDWLEFIGTMLQTEAIYSRTCFGGGYNLQLILQFLNNLHTKNHAFKPYIYLCGTLTDCVSPSACELDFITYFNELASYCRLHALKTGNKNSKKREMALKRALKAVSKFDSILSMPQYFEPGMQSAQVVNLDGALHIFNDASRKSIKIDQHQQGILLYVQSADCTIKLAEKRYPFFISMIPGDVTHKFTALDASQHELDCLLENAFFGFVESSKKTFIFNKLTALNYTDSGLPQEQKLVSLEDAIIEKEMKNLGDGELLLIGTVYAKIAGTNDYYKATFEKSDKSKKKHKKNNDDNKANTFKYIPQDLTDEEMESEDNLTCVECFNTKPLQFVKITRAEYDKVRGAYGLPAIATVAIQAPVPAKALKQTAIAMRSLVVAQITKAKPIAPAIDHMDHKHCVEPAPEGSNNKWNAAIQYKIHHRIID